MVYDNKIKQVERHEDETKLKELCFNGHTWLSCVMVKYYPFMTII